MTAVEVIGVSKDYGLTPAVRDLSFSARPGRVTCFLGPNGAGKTTTLRVLLGLVQPDRGRATIGGRRYRDLPDPTATVGAVLDLAGAHPGMSARTHLRLAARLGRHAESTVMGTLEQVGLASAADRRIGGFSTGMRQRLALATALIGDPAVLVLDEPSSGLDPVGNAWLRDTLCAWAAEGRTVLVSSHQLSELQQVADDMVLIDQGRLVQAAPLAELTAERSLEQVFLACTGNANPAGGAR